MTTVAALAILILIAAALYSSVGHAGASGYLAAMALFNLTPAVMRPTALALNLLVGAIAAYKFYRAGRFDWSLFWPFALTSIPCSFIGGLIQLPGTYYRPIVGLVLLYAAYRLIRGTQFVSDAAIKAPPVWLALLCGAGLGLLSGLTGVGGGIFLSPLLLFMGWAEVKQTAGVSAMFILVNSLAGLLGQLSSVASLPKAIPVWAAAAVIGGWVGAEYGSRRLAGASLRRLLGVVLVIAGVKFLFPALQHIVSVARP
ncbi:MAG TPA: sulfite exporter TauE/SafE family protein [Blastocatellia bacterium]|nr:sulfite exporter TauE/SafE family protein [Blastocatellia bacterium]